MGFAGYFLCAASTGWDIKACWVVQYIVIWATGCYVTVVGSNCFGSNWELRHWAIGWWLDGMSSVEMGCTLGSDFTLWYGGVPGVAIGTLGDRCLCVKMVQRGSTVVDIYDFVSPFQCSMVSWRALMAWSCASNVDDGVFLSATRSCCTPCNNLSSGVTEGRVSLWCLNSMVSDTISVLVSLDTTFWQR